MQYPIILYGKDIHALHVSQLGFLRHLDVKVTSLTYERQNNVVSAFEVAVYDGG